MTVFTNTCDGPNGTAVTITSSDADSDNWSAVATTHGSVMYGIRGLHVTSMGGADTQVGVEWIFTNADARAAAGARVFIPEGAYRYAVPLITIYDTQGYEFGLVSVLPNGKLEVYTYSGGHPSKASVAPVLRGAWSWVELGTDGTTLQASVYRDGVLMPDESAALPNAVLGQQADRVMFGGKYGTVAGDGEFLLREASAVIGDGELVRPGPPIVLPPNIFRHSGNGPNGTRISAYNAPEDSTNWDGFGQFGSGIVQIDAFYDNTHSPPGSSAIRFEKTAAAYWTIRGPLPTRCVAAVDVFHTQDGSSHEPALVVNILSSNFGRICRVRIDTGGHLSIELPDGVSHPAVGALPENQWCRVVVEVDSAARIVRATATKAGVEIPNASITIADPQFSSNNSEIKVVQFGAAIQDLPNTWTQWRDNIEVLVGPGDLAAPGDLLIHDGSAFVHGEALTWEGAAFVPSTSVKTWNGTAWVPDLAEPGLGTGVNYLSPPNGNFFDPATSQPSKGDWIFAQFTRLTAFGASDGLLTIPAASSDDRRAYIDVPLEVADARGKEYSFAFQIQAEAASPPAGYVFHGQIEWLDSSGAVVGQPSVGREYHTIPGLWGCAELGSPHRVPAVHVASVTGDRPVTTARLSIHMAYQSPSKWVWVSWVAFQEGAGTDYVPPRAA
jgi:hypothetical protein